MLLFVICILQSVLFANIYAADGDVRLADADHRTVIYENRQFVYGRVELSYESDWGTVCWDRWTYHESKTVCEEIGYHRPSNWRRSNRDNVVQDRIILMDYFYCNREKKLIECRNNGYNNVHDRCTHYDDVWVECYRNLPTRVSELPIRLINPQTIIGYDSDNNTYVGDHAMFHAGLLQAKYRDTWYYVSGVGWDTVDAKVACGQLGYPDVNSIPEYFPDVALNNTELISVTMEELDCIGNERELKECYHSGWLFSNYNVSDLAAVNCMTREQFLSTKETVFRLRSGSNYWEGRLEVLHDLYWGSVCGKGFTLTHGDIACKSLGFGKAQEVFPSANSGYGRGVGMIWKGDFECDNPLTADSLLECDSSKWGFSSCRYDHVFDVGIKCNVPTPERKVRVLDEYSPRSYYRTPGVRFYFIEFLHEDSWEAPCCYTLLLRHTIDTLCKQLGLGAGVYHLTTCDFVPYKRKLTGLDGFMLCFKNDDFSENCLGKFRNTQQCNYGYNLIACSKDLPDLVPSLLFFERSLRFYSPEAGAVVLDERARNRIEYSKVGDLTCAIEDKCLASSTDSSNPNQVVKLLRFASHTDNYGLLPLYPPVPQREWVWHNCHEHFHSMEVFVTYHLLDRQGSKVAEGHKASFCLEDSSCAIGQERFFYCDQVQGISVNCGDHYGAELDCQWIDITGVPPGNYTVEVTVNPAAAILESNYENNILSCMIDLDADGFYSTYNCLHSDHIIERKLEEEEEPDIV